MSNWQWPRSKMAVAKVQNGNGQGSKQYIQYKRIYDYNNNNKNEAVNTQIKKIELRKLCIKKGIKYGNYKKRQKFELINMLQFYYSNFIINF